MTSATNTRNPNLDSKIQHQLSSAIAGATGENLAKQETILSTLRKNWWTGLAPERCPGFSEQGGLRSLTPPNQATCTPQDVRAYFDNTWTLTEVLFESLKNAEAFLLPPYHNLRHPMIFYYVHTAVVYVNKLRVARLIDKPVNAYFEQLFETGVDEMSWDDLSKNEMEWPSLDECHAYRKTVYSLLTEIISTHADLKPGHAPIGMSHPLWALFMGFEHERIHLETSSVLIRELPLHLVSRPKAFAPLHPSAHAPSHFPPRLGIDYPAPKLLKIEGERVHIGKPFSWPTFGWDNEYGAKDCDVPAFESSPYLVSNGEFWEFVSQGGYRDESLWTHAGWQWRQYRNVKWPTFWVPDGPQGSFRFKLRACFEVIDMPWSWPAVVNYHEAKAFANWRTKNSQASYRLLTEAEHYRLRAKTDPGGEAPSFERWYGGPANPPSVHVTTSNFDLRFGSESPVNDQSEKAHIPFSDVFGNVWQWLEDDFHPLEGFKVHPYYDDFSTPCFDGRHTAMTGGSFISTGDEASYYERFHFRPHFYQHAGFRLVVAQEGSLEKLAGRVARKDHEENSEQARRALAEQLSLHYGSLDVTLPASLVQMPGGERLARFPEEVAETAISWARKLHLSAERAIEVGCSVGGGVFKLTEHFKSVLGIDPNLAFVQAARTLKERGELAYDVIEEGEILNPALARVPSATSRIRAEFRQADASALPAEYANFDTVILNHVLDRVPSPKGVLSRLSGARGLVKPGGVLVITTAFEWDSRLTPKEVWLGGFSAGQGPQESYPTLKTILTEDFEELETLSALEIIRQSRRRYLLLEPIITVWRRK